MLRFAVADVGRGVRRPHRELHAQPLAALDQPEVPLRQLDPDGHLPAARRRCAAAAELEHPLALAPLRRDDQAPRRAQRVGPVAARLARRAGQRRADRSLAAEPEGADQGARRGRVAARRHRDRHRLQLVRADVGRARSRCGGCRRGPSRCCPRPSARNRSSASRAPGGSRRRRRSRTAEEAPGCRSPRSCCRSPRSPGCKFELNRLIAEVEAGSRRRGQIDFGVGDHVRRLDRRARSGVGREDARARRCAARSRRPSRCAASPCWERSPGRRAPCAPVGLDARSRLSRTTAPLPGRNAVAGPVGGRRDHLDAIGGRVVAGQQHGRGGTRVDGLERQVAERHGGGGCRAPRRRSGPR